MQIMNINKPFRAKCIRFKDNREPQNDCIIFAAYPFLIVGKDENDTAPTWYNTDDVSMIEGVEELPKQPNYSNAVFF